MTAELAEAYCDEASAAFPEIVRKGPRSLAYQHQDHPLSAIHWLRFKDGRLEYAHSYWGARPFVCGYDAVWAWEDGTGLGLGDMAYLPPPKGEGPPA